MEACDDTTPDLAVLTVKQVQADLGMSKNAVYEAIGRGEIPSVRVGRRILVPRGPYKRFLAGEHANPK
jgi:excisionase family DNA binding protein